jgi:U3 small nucleolar RNA-associated protein 4
MSEAATGEPVLNTKVHRLRHLRYQPQGIVSMIATPSWLSSQNPESEYVAVSYESGSVALHNPTDKWRTLAILAGRNDQIVHSMAWVTPAEDDLQDPKIMSTRQSLVGASQNGTLFIVDFCSGRFRAITPSAGGGIFSLVNLSQPYDSTSLLTSFPSASMVAAGCEDGSVRIYALTKKNEDYRLNLVSTIPTAGSSVLSLAWRRFKTTTESSRHDIHGTVLFAGVADGTIRRYECRTHNPSLIFDPLAYDSHPIWFSTIRMTMESEGRTTPTRVWALLTLSDGTVVSGDSLGHVQFWDGSTGTLLQSFDQNDKKADVLALAVTPNECQVFASGIDPRIVSMERSQTTYSHDTSSSQGWIMTHAQRPHTHDVKALTISRLSNHESSSAQQKSPICILCSAGVDTKLCTFPVGQFHNGRPRIRFPWPTFSPIRIAKDARIMVLRRQSTIELHQLGSLPNGAFPYILDEEKQFIGTLDIKSHFNLVCSDISPDGRYLVVGTEAKFMAFYLEYIENADGTKGVNPKKLSLSKETEHPCLATAFLQKDLVLCTYSDDSIKLFKFIPKSKKAGTVQLTHIDSLIDADVNVNSVFAIHSVITSRDGQYFVTVRNGKESSVLHVFQIRDCKIYLYWVLAALEAPVSCTGFHAADSSKLIVACSNYAMYVFDLKLKKLTKWSEMNGYPVTPSLPIELEKNMDFPKFIVTSTISPEKFILVRTP